MFLVHRILVLTTAEAKNDYQQHQHQKAEDERND